MSIDKIIASIEPYDTIEQEHILDTMRWIASGAPIYRISKPDNPPKHLVSYSLVLDEKSKKILLVDHKKSELWLPAGGHVDVDEDPKVAASRECLEELGIEAEFWREDPIFITQAETVGLTAGHTDVSLWYVIKGCSKYSYEFDTREFYGVKWFEFNEIPYERSDPHMQRFVAKLQGMLC